ncbi:hypothetical protein CQW23_23028 [Capsicum baccatum]|uniref:Uncharacterized protein n=1 Tax=Capsicum baccatum TaxID=33114 RepID=A0A2G2W2K6_CAPBA|nr:hypothetical protein CQW23_23028 [Capsicum baccatum]
MGGQGETTIARKVYNNGSIVDHFDVQALCIISQSYNQRDLLQEIFSQVTGKEDKGDKEDILADELKKRLTGKSYLIVLDDMWDGKAWDDLRFSFPDVGNRSRIVITTRLEEVAKQVKHHVDPYSLPFLTPDESLKLLQKKVFQQESCPPSLQDVSKAVAERYKGLPLVIVLVAGIIKRNKMEASWWHEVKNSLVSYHVDSEGYSLSTMQLSYDNLPDHLRPCLLHMGMFPEDSRIPVSELISLWIAECFVQNIEESGRLEETAEGYLNDLISSNVMMVSGRRYNGKVKYCQVHDVVLHFCLNKIREEKFMLAVKGNPSRFQSSRWKDRRVSFNFTDEIFSLGSKTFRQRLRSVIITHKGNSCDENSVYQVSDMRLVKVLDLNCPRDTQIWLRICRPLIHLKYLAVHSIANYDWELHLPHLETLIVRKIAKGAPLPTNFWKMEKLRHVETPECIVDWYKDEGMFYESSKLENLMIFKKVFFKESDNLDVLLRKCPNLQQLGISFMKAPIDDSMSGEDDDSTSGEDDFVKPFHINMERRFLSFREYLQLINYHGWNKSKEWCIPPDVTLHKLRLLKLVDASEESFPQLETLVIRSCYKLEKTPLSFADIPTLKQVKLIWSLAESLEASAVRIKENVIENEGNDRIEIITKVALSYNSDIPRAIWNLPLTRRGNLQPECDTRVGVSDFDTSHGSRPA